MKKYFNWKFINSPSGHRLLLIVVIAGLVIWWTFRPVKKSGSGVFDPAAKLLIDSLERANGKLRQQDSVTRSENEKLKQERSETKTKIKTEYEYRDKIIVIWDTASANTINEYFTREFGN
jgi:hypothetical protein